MPNLSRPVVEISRCWEKVRRKTIEGARSDQRTDENDVRGMNREEGQVEPIPSPQTILYHHPLL